ncbi:unnamed protein product [Fraxinus pennsylvanica]|uniref:PAS domain-containing protein n=1 Tax=Fraxinus pennsylvanica TaxID=56036 RepID=A0AAD1Z4A4_9LAMI|nr:unnamed protein product [Fraxinus pennsylvanica]
MHPISSFKAFLEVVKRRSLPWEVSEINAIHTLPKLDELSYMAAEIVRLIETASAPIFWVNLYDFINGLNAKIIELTGLQATDTIGKSLVNDNVYENSCGVVKSVLHKAMEGKFI